MEIPGSGGQLLIVLLFVLPGSVYQAVRQRLRGPAPDDINFSTKLFRALGVSTALIAGYLACAGGPLLRLSRAPGADAPSWQGVAQHPVITGWLVLLLLLVVPALLGVADFARANRGFAVRALAYNPIPRAWDFAFKDREPCFVRVLTVEGTWLGGWFGDLSYVSSYPEPREIFIERVHTVGLDGRLGAEKPGNAGLYLRCDDIRAVEMLQPQLPSALVDRGGSDAGN